MLRVEMDKTLCVAEGVNSEFKKSSSHWGVARDTDKDVVGIAAGAVRRERRCGSLGRRNNYVI
jgi:hypothetical protein